MMPWWERLNDVDWVYLPERGASYPVRKWWAMPYRHVCMFIRKLRGIK